MAGVGTLALAALVWIGVHVGIAGTALRGTAVARLGDNGFRIGFSLLSLATIVFLVRSYNTAGTAPLWFAPEWLRWLLVALMLPVFVLFMASMKGNPTMVGGETSLGGEPRGIQRVTRHPMLWSFALWAAVHMVGNGDTASLVFFGAFLVTALAGMPSIDAKVAARDPGAWDRYAARTSILPFGAIAAGRNRFEPGEVGWRPVLIGGVLWLALLGLHRSIFGVAPVSAFG